MNITHWLQHIANTYGTDPFVSGDCHNLCAALYHSDREQGNVIACIRVQFDTEGVDFSRTYSHMVYECKDGIIWDISGKDADTRWTYLWPSEDEFDSDGLANRFEWVEVDPKEMNTWLTAWHCQLNPILVKNLIDLGYDIAHRIDAAASQPSRPTPNTLGSP